MAGHPQGGVRRALMTAGTLIGVWAGCSNGVAAPTICFSASDNARLAFAAIQQAPPPSPGAADTYPGYPFSDLVTMQLGRIASDEKGAHQYYAQWANRADRLATGGRQLSLKANLQPRTQGSRVQRSGFTSVERANFCTLAQTSSVLGLPMDQLRARALSLGVTLREESKVADTGGVAADNLCVLAEGRLPASAAGIMLDYEVGDGRTPAETAAFLVGYADLVHRAGKRVGLLLDPLDAPSQQRTGIDQSNAAKIARRFDWSTIFLWAANRQHDLRGSFASQMAILNAGGGVDPRRLVVDFELSDTTLPDAAAARSLILAYHLRGVMFWRHGVSQGGACQEPANRKIACVAFGNCGS
jgi:hypothetical protein